MTTKGGGAPREIPRLTLTAACGVAGMARSHVMAEMMDAPRSTVRRDISSPCVRILPARMAHLLCACAFEDVKGRHLHDGGYPGTSSLTTARIYSTPHILLRP